MSNPLNPDCQFEQDHSRAQLADTRITHFPTHQPTNFQQNNGGFETPAEHRLSGEILQTAGSPAVQPPCWAIQPQLHDGSPATTNSSDEDDLGFQPLFVADYVLLEFQEGWEYPAFGYDSELGSGAGIQTPSDNGDIHEQPQNGDIAINEHHQRIEGADNFRMDPEEHYKQAVNIREVPKLIFKCPEPGCPKEYTTKAGLDYHTKTGHGRNGHNCPKCKRNFKGPASLAKHVAKTEMLGGECQQEQTSSRPSLKRPYTPGTSTADGKNAGKRVASNEAFNIPAVVKAAGKPRKHHARPPTFEEGFGSATRRTTGGKYFTNGMIAMD